MDSYVIIQHSDNPPRLIGPFSSHQEANGWMQKDYDTACEEAGDLQESDDSDASHFYAVLDDQEIDWTINEVEAP